MRYNRSIVRITTNSSMPTTARFTYACFDSAGYTNTFNIGALMEKGIRFIGNGQAPVHLYWEEILNDYIIPGKFDPTL